MANPYDLEAMYRLGRKRLSCQGHEAELAALRAQLAAAQAELTDWILVADGVKHDWRCDAPQHPCLRCQLETAREAARREAFDEAIEIATQEIGNPEAIDYILDKLRAQRDAPPERDGKE